MLVTLATCGHRPTAEPASVELRGDYYRDNTGLTVATYGARLNQPITSRATVELRALVDTIEVDGRQAFDPATQSAGQPTADAVTSASATIAGGGVAHKSRYEGVAALRTQGQLGSAVVALGGVARVSSEKDYASISGGAHGSVELFDRNLALAGFVGYGRDQVKPIEPPPGAAGEWPARHRRWTFTGSATQILSPTVLVSLGGGVTLQSGQLASPYRRAIVGTTLFPESLPRARERFTVFAAASWEIEPGLALHLRQGLYRDSWEVAALIPEAVLALELESGLVLSPRYRYYRQTSAAFYQVRYAQIEAVMSGDLRLGSVQDHTLGVDLRWDLPAGSAGTTSIPVYFGYDVSLLDYRDTAIRVVAHMLQLGVGLRH